MKELIGEMNVYLLRDYFKITVNMAEKQTLKRSSLTLLNKKETSLQA